MRISDVVGADPRPVRTVRAGETIADTVDLLAEYGIGAVVVTADKRQIDGIISERDVVRHLAHEQEGTLRIPVEELMTTSVSTCHADSEIDGVMATMIAGRFRHMPVVDANNELCALVSLADLVNARLGQLEAQNRELRELSAR